MSVRGLSVRARASHSRGLWPGQAESVAKNARTCTPHAKIFIGIAGRTIRGRDASGGAGLAGLEDLVVRADGAPDGDVLGADEGDDARAHGGGDVHRSAVVTDQKIELSGEGGELANRQGAVDDDQMRLGRGSDGFE